MFNNDDFANEFLQYLNSRHNNIKFTIEFEHDKAIPFFDILVKRGPNNIFMICLPGKRHSQVFILNETLSVLANTKYYYTRVKLSDGSMTERLNTSSL